MQTQLGSNPSPRLSKLQRLQSHFFLAHGMVENPVPHRTNVITICLRLFKKSSIYQTPQSPIVPVSEEKDAPIL